MEQYEINIINNKLGMLSMSSGIETGIGRHTLVKDDNLANFFTSCSHMAKLIYVGPEASCELISTLH